MRFNLIDLTDERKKDIEDMHITNPLTGEVYKKIDFKVSANMDSSYVVFIPKTNDENIAIFIVGTYFYRIEMDIKTTVLEGRVNIDGNKMLHEYREIRIKENAVQAYYSEALCYGVANYFASTVDEDSIVRKSNVYFGDKLVKQEFFHLSSGEIFNEVFRRKVSGKRIEEIKELKISNPYFDYYNPRYYSVIPSDTANEDNYYVYARRLRRPDPDRKSDSDKEIDNYSYIFFARGNKWWFIKILSKDLMGKSQGYNLKYRCQTLHYKINIDAVEDFDETDILALVSSIVVNEEPSLLSEYNESKFRIKYGNRYIVEEFYKCLSLLIGEK